MSAFNFNSLSQAGETGGGIPFSLYNCCGIDGDGGNLLYSNLACDNLNDIGFSFEHDYQYPFEETIEKEGGTVDVLKNALTQTKAFADGWNSGGEAKVGKENEDKMLYSIWKKTPAYKGTSVIKVPSSLTFSFHFGQWGLFNAYSEVVAPILNIAASFAPTENGETLGNLPLPLSGTLFGKAASAMIKGNAGKDILSQVTQAAAAKAEKQNEENNEQEDNGENASLELQKELGLFQRVAGVVRQFDNIAKNAYSNSNRAVCKFSIGNITSKAFVVGSVSFKFNLSNIDENGYPIYGTLTIGNLTSPSMAVSSIIS
jgi:hypothetical protein